MLEDIFMIFLLIICVLFWMHWTKRINLRIWWHGKHMEGTMWKTEDLRDADDKPMTMILSFTGATTGTSQAIKSDGQKFLIPFTYRHIANNTTFALNYSATLPPPTTPPPTSQPSSTTSAPQTTGPPVIIAGIETQIEVNSNYYDLNWIVPIVSKAVNFQRYFE